MRLDKLLFELGYGSRGFVKKILSARQVRVDEEIVTLGNTNVSPMIQNIYVQNKRVIYTKEAYYMLNKPIGVVTAVTDKKHQTVIDCIDEKDKKIGLYPVGRLDRDTKGLVFITNNGPLGFRMLHPKYHVSKRYEVVVNACLTQEDVIAFRNGITFLDGYTCQSASLTIIQASDTKSIALVDIHEGKFHQIKKMFLSVGKKVISLTRISFAELVLDSSLKEGEYRALTPNELQQLKKYLQ
ncbi:pseudouridine synthase [Granulicatella sp. zg-ZJ]|uniref:16S rRNA pseudouridine(516) synthase n=1 Tax=Granulicatella sp. zg-ZJ TaxID=2678504 RepID=UPI0013CF48B8|nr:pseudouridine synthase [Granulicatella sp. zg-ZJ]NEW62062.1 pseudouridine synthase [Granulicatella sp. zg-ZJ]